MIWCLSVCLSVPHVASTLKIARGAAKLPLVGGFMPYWRSNAADVCFVFFFLSFSFFVLMFAFRSVLQSAITLLTVGDPAQKCVGQGQGHPRKVTIEMYSEAGSGKRRKSKARSFNDLHLVSRSAGDLPHRNLSTSMTLLVWPRLVAG